MEIIYNAKKWSINRRYKEFCELNEGLIEEFPNSEFPESAMMFMKSSSETANFRKTGSIEERRDNLQKYLRDLSMIPSIRESTVFKQFLGLSPHYTEEHSGHYYPKNEDTIENIVSSADPLKPLSQN